MEDHIKLRLLNKVANTGPIIDIDLDVNPPNLRLSDSCFMHEQNIMRMIISFKIVLSFCSLDMMIQKLVDEIDSDML